MENSVNQNQKSETGQNSQIPKMTSDQNNEALFYNVMPHIKSTNDVIVDPKIKTIISTKSPDSQNEGLMAKIKKYKIFVVIFLALLIGIPVGYYLINLYGSSLENSGDPIVVSPGSDRPKNPTPPPEKEGFTTPKEWRGKYFPNCDQINTCGDGASPDNDGLSNLEEYNLKADPNNPDSDQDGIADGDEYHVFGSDPMNDHTANDDKYSDLDYVKGGYDFKSGDLLTPEQLAAVSEKMKTFGLHQLTVKSLGNVLTTIYKFDQNSQPPPPPTEPTTTPETLTTDLPAGTDNSINAQQDRDTQRSNAIKNVEIALVNYQKDKKSYPITKDFATMFSEIKPYWKVAINPTDPINKGQYVYSYESDDKGADFVLSYYSESAKQLIKKTAADAQKDAALQEAELFDNQRQLDLERLRTSLLLYSKENVDGNQEYVFPAEDKYKAALVPDFISEIPKDPKTGQDYEYKTTSTFDTFTLKAVLGNPATGTTGWVCNQEECRPY